MTGENKINWPQVEGLASQYFTIGTEIGGEPTVHALSDAHLRLLGEAGIVPNITEPLVPKADYGYRPPLSEAA